MLAIKEIENDYLMEIKKNPRLWSYSKRGMQYYHNVYWCIRRAYDKYVSENKEITNVHEFLNESTKDIFNTVYSGDFIETGSEAVRYLRSFYLISESDRKAIELIAYEDILNKRLLTC